jgi:hypothetical protein
MDQLCCWWNPVHARGAVECDEAIGGERMTTRLKSVIGFAALLLSLVVGQSQLHPQTTVLPFVKQLPDQFSKDPYVIGFADMLDAWNAGKLELPSKADLRTAFQQNLSKTVQLKLYSYETEAWQADMLKNFDQLPATVKPEKMLDSAAGDVLMVLFLKDLDQFEKQVRPQEAKAVLSLPLFVILASAQQATIERKQTVINSNRVLESLFAWWTTTWPFCRRSNA